MTTPKIPRPPAGSKAAGRSLWRAILADFDLEEHELALLRQACRVADTCDDLQTLVDNDGPMVAGRTHPALTELRQQRITLARLIGALRVPLGEQQEDGQPVGRSQYRGTRGVYGIKGVVG